MYNSDKELNEQLDKLTETKGCPDCTDKVCWAFFIGFCLGIFL